MRLHQYLFAVLLVLLDTIALTAAASTQKFYPSTEKAAVISYLKQLQSLTYSVNDNENEADGLEGHQTTLHDKRVLLRRLNATTYKMHHFLAVARSFQVPSSCGAAQRYLLDALQLEDQFFRAGSRHLRWGDKLPRAHARLVVQLDMLQMRSHVASEVEKLRMRLHVSHEYRSYLQTFL